MGWICLSSVCEASRPTPIVYCEKTVQDSASSTKCFIVVCLTKFYERWNLELQSDLRSHCRFYFGLLWSSCTLHSYTICHRQIQHYRSPCVDTTVLVPKNNVWKRWKSSPTHRPLPQTQDEVQVSAK